MKPKELERKSESETNLVHARNHYYSALLPWAAFLIPSGMIGMNVRMADQSFFNSTAVVYAILIFLFLGWLCKGFTLGEDHLVVSRFAGLWQQRIYFSEIYQVYVGQRHCLVIETERGLIRVWPSTCFRLDELISDLNAALSQTDKEPNRNTHVRDRLE